MADRTVRRATPRSGYYNGVSMSTMRRRDLKSISQLEQERRRRENFEKGSRWAGIAMIAMFLFLSFGCVMWAW